MDQRYEKPMSCSGFLMAIVIAAAIGHVLGGPVLDIIRVVEASFVAGF